MAAHSPSSSSAPYLLPTHAAPRVKARLKAKEADPPGATLCDIGVAARVTGIREFDETLLVMPFEPEALAGIRPDSLRAFRWEGGGYEPVWRSGVNLELGQAWARISRTGVYVLVGLPRDPLLFEAIRAMAVERKTGGDAPEDALRELFDLDSEALGELRELLVRIEVQHSADGMSLRDVEIGTGGHPIGARLPGGAGLEEFRGRLKELKMGAGGLPEEQLFQPPWVACHGEPPWNGPAGSSWNGVDPGTLHPSLKLWKHLDLSDLLHRLPWLFDQDWWMYAHDTRHTGHASGLSDINSLTVSGLYRHATVTVDGPVVSQPAIVNGKVYIGSGKSGGTGGTLYRIDLATGAVEQTLATTGSAYYSWVSGIGGTPAVTGGRVYFTGVHGTVYCVNAATFTTIWSVSLKAADFGHNQPVTNPNSDSWSGPLVVNGRVYVGCGEGESPTTYGFIFCLDANTGNVLWCFCTCRFAGGADNQPNHLPASVAAPWAGSHGFTVLPNPPETGCSVWSSCAYDHVHDAIFVGTGNSQYPHTAQPDELYGSGLISLDAVTGAFRGFFQPTADDSYWPGDDDIDVPGSATVYTLTGRRVVAFGSKTGSVFVLDAGDITNVVARRQLLPRDGGTGLPGSRGTGIPQVVPTGGTGENSYGVFGTPAVHAPLGRLFVGLGGYNGMALDAGGGDPTRTPFVRALNWNDLTDAWPTAVGADNVIRYTSTKPPMYMSRDVGLSSPAVVSDVVFVATSPPPFSTDRAHLYALSVLDGHCLWSSGGLAQGSFALGPAIYGNYVVVGAGNQVSIFRLGPRWRFPIPWKRLWPWDLWPPYDLPRPGPWPGPDPGPWPGPWPGPGPDPPPFRPAHLG